MKPRKILRGLAPYAVILLLLLLLLAGTVRAAEGASSLTLAPAEVAARGSFGQSVTSAFTMTNTTDATRSFELVAYDVVVRGGQRVFAPAGAEPHGIAATAVFSREHLTIDPQTAAAVVTRFTIPARSDVRAVVVMFRATGTPRTAAGTVAMSGSLGALITFNLGDAVSLAAAPPSITPPTVNGNLRVQSLLANDGKEPLVPSGVVALIDATGKLAAKSPIPAQRLLPGERLPFVVELPARPGPGRYKALSTFSFEGRTVTTSTDFTLP